MSPTPWSRIALTAVAGLIALTTWTAAANAQLLSADDQRERAEIEARLAEIERLRAAGLLEVDPPNRAPEGGELAMGPDVTIINLADINNYTSAGGTACPPGYSGNCRGYSIGTDSCNIGTVPVDWCDATGGCRTTTDDYHPIAPATNTDHSVIGQNLYRLKDGRFEQIGVSFLKHGFVSLNTPDGSCVWNDNGTPNTSCVSPPAGGDQLGVGCTDFYSASLNGSRPMGRRSDVNAASGDHPENPGGGETDDAYDQRIVVSEADLDPALNAGALYWMEGQYVVRDDGRSGPTASPPPPGGAEGTINAWLGENGLNNASYRQVTVGGLPSLNISFTGPTVREKAAIYAWQEVDPEVEIVNADRQTFFVGDPIDPPSGPGNHPDHWVVERFEAARRVTKTTEGVFPFHYEYAIHNINSDTSADGFVVQFPGPVSFGNVGFHDIDHHSGEPFDTTDWSINVDGPNGRITWTAADAGANTNALRWGTTFSFWFDADTAPTTMTHELDLFKIDEMLDVPFASQVDTIFEDGFESGLDPWDNTVEN